MTFLRTLAGVPNQPVPHKLGFNFVMVSVVGSFNMLVGWLVSMNMCLNYGVEFILAGTYAEMFQCVNFTSKVSINAYFDSLQASVPSDSPFC